MVVQQLPLLTVFFLSQWIVRLTPELSASSHAEESVQLLDYARRTVPWHLVFVFSKRRLLCVHNENQHMHFCLNFFHFDGS